MKAAEFCYWLQGYFELTGAEPNAITAEQAAIIKAHLALVFIHDIDPAATAGLPKHAADAKQQQLNDAHFTPGSGYPAPPPGTRYRC